MDLACNWLKVAFFNLPKYADVCGPTRNQQLAQEPIRCDKENGCRENCAILIRDLEKAGFVDRGGKGSHRNFVHPKVRKPITLSGHEGADALHYQERAVTLAIEESKK